MVRMRAGVVVGMILTAAAARLIPHPPNLTPITAMALFGGAHFPDARLAFLVTGAALLLSDLVLGLHNLIPVVYGSLALIVGIGLTLRRRRRVLPIAGAALASSLLFFVVTNFGVWALTSLYPKTLAGLLACYAAALPFVRNTLLGDMLYTAVLFGGFALAERSLPALREKTFVSTE